MIPTYGHIFLAAAALALLAACFYAAAWLRHRGFGRGTPQYAHGRDGRRFAIWSLAAALLLAAIGCLTPLYGIAIG